MKTCVGLAVKNHIFLTLVLDVSCPGLTSLGKSPYYTLDSGWMVPRASQDVVAKIKIPAQAGN
jgi:hypothetical protein